MYSLCRCSERQLYEIRGRSVASTVSSDAVAVDALRGTMRTHPLPELAATATTICTQQDGVLIALTAAWHGNCAHTALPYDRPARPVRHR